MGRYFDEAMRLSKAGYIDNLNDIRDESTSSGSKVIHKYGSDNSPEEPDLMSWDEIVKMIRNIAKRQAERKAPTGIPLITFSADGQIWRGSRLVLLHALTTK